MGVKRGYIADEDTPGDRGSTRIRRFKLSNGEHVYLPLDVAGRIIAQHSPAEEFVFVEKGLLGRTAWAGTIGEVRKAVAAGYLSPKDISGLRLPIQELVPGWNAFENEDDYSFVGAKLAALAEDLRRHGMVDTANEMTLDSWLAHARQDGACLAERAESIHGRVWCEADRGHTGGHVPACPACGLVKVIVYASAQRGGMWR